MILRLGFVSNSSSSSFILNLSMLTDEQREAAFDPEKYMTTRYPGCIKKEYLGGPSIRLIGELSECGWWDRGWRVLISDDLALFQTMMDNFNYRAFLQKILKIPENAFLDCTFPFPNEDYQDEHDE